MNIQESLQRLKDLNKERLILEAEIEPLLLKYSGGHSIEKIITEDNHIDFLVGIYHWGYNEDWFSVTYNYFDNPEEYIQKEKELAKIHEEECRKKELERGVEEERVRYEELKKKFEGSEQLKKRFEESKFD